VTAVRRLDPEDAVAYREIRLEALSRHPEAFGAAFEEEAAQPLTYFADRLAGSFVFAAYDDAGLLGTAGLRVLGGRKSRHKGFLWGVYVRERARGSGAAQVVLDAVIGRARDEVELIQLSVVTGNERAVRLYRSRGFAEYGLERRSLKLGEHYFDELLMVKFLAADPVIDARADA
jgi:ribosomal protein S18 acetylase RimI-like enzyme